MHVKILSSKHATSYRNIRLEALKNHPEAFASSYEEEKQFSIDHFESRIQDDGIYTFGAFEQEDLVGVVTLILERKSKLEHRANIVAMYVRNEKRKLGMGKELMLSAINHARYLGSIKQIYLAVTSINVPAKKLYESLGFECYGKDRNALKIKDTYYDEDLMVLSLVE